MAGVTNDYLTSEEVLFLAEQNLGHNTMRSGGDPVMLESFATPTLDYALRAAEEGTNFQTQNGGIEYEVQGMRNQRIEWWDGTQKLTFEGHLDAFNLRYSIGKGHLGDMVVLDVVERTGVRVKYGEGIRSQSEIPKGQAMRVANYFQKEKKRILATYKLDLAVRFWTDNSDAAKAFAGFDALFPTTTNSTGDIGEKNRGNVLLRHQLMTGITAANIDNSMTKMERALEDACGNDGTKTGLIVVGDDAFDVLVDSYKGPSGQVKLQMQTERAAAFSDKYRIGLPKDAFIGASGVPITRDQSWNKIDQLYPSLTNPMRKRMAFINWGHLEFLSEKHLENIVHAMPYDQRVQFSSWHGAYVLGTDKPRAQGWMIFT